MNGLNVRQLESVVQQLEAQVNTYKERIHRQDLYIESASKSTQEIVDACRIFCMELLEQEITQGRVTSKELQQMPLLGLLTFAKNIYKSNQQKTKDVYTQFAQKLEEKAMVISGLQSQNSQLQIQLAQAVQTGEKEIPDLSEKDPDLQRQTAYLVDSGKTDVEEIKPALGNTSQLENNDSVDDFAKSIVVETSNVTAVAKAKPQDKNAMMVDYEDYKSQMTPLMWLILRIMGEEGLCEFPEIKARCLALSKKEDGVGITTLNAALAGLRNINAISRQIKINTGVRWFYVYELEEIGYRLYVDEFQKPPVESEIKKLVREHDNIVHGYYIKEAAAILREKYDYQSISTSRKANYIQLPNSKASIPDIVCAKKGSVDYYEVECGNHQSADFNDKCNKLRMITKNIYFIVPDVEVMNKKMVPRIEAWIKSVGGYTALAKSNTVVYLTTMKKLLNKEWVMIWDMKQAEPISTMEGTEKK